MEKVYLGLGTDIGDRKKNLGEAKTGIKESIGTIVDASPVYETEAWGFKSENKFLNQIICVKTNLSPSGLLGRIMIIESQLGRFRSVKQYASRIIDIDILLYSNQIVEDASLIIPHPSMHKRRFVMVPLCEIAPYLIHPVLKKRMRTLLKICPDSNRVVLFNNSL